MIYEVGELVKTTLGTYGVVTEANKATGVTKLFALGENPEVLSTVDFMLTQLGHQETQIAAAIFGGQIAAIRSCGRCTPHPMPRKYFVTSRGAFPSYLERRISRIDEVRVLVDVSLFYYQYSPRLSPSQQTGYPPPSEALIREHILKAGIRDLEFLALAAYYDGLCMPHIVGTGIDKPALVSIQSQYDPTPDTGEQAASPSTQQASRSLIPLFTPKLGEDFTLNPKDNAVISHIQLYSIGTFSEVMASLCSFS